MASIVKASLLILDKQMQLVVNAYFASRKKKKHFNQLLDVDKEDVNRYQSYINRVEDIFLLLTSQEQVIINNEYFHEDYPYWWMKSYTKRDFKKNKKKALIHFLRLFYEE